MKRLLVSALFLSLPGCLAAATQDKTIIPPTMVIERSLKSVGGEPLIEPAGLAVDRVGRIYFTDAGQHRLYCVDSNFQLIRSVGGFGSGDGDLNRPGIIHLDNNLNLLVVDQGNRRVCRFDARLNYSGTLPLGPDSIGQPFDPSGVVALTDGSVWVADRRQHRIAVISSAGQFDRYIGDFGSTGGSLSSPEQLSSGSNDMVVILDRGNDRLVTYDRYGSFVGELLLDPLVSPAGFAVSNTQGTEFLVAARGGIWLVNEQSKLLCSFPQLPSTGSNSPCTALIALRPATVLMTLSGEAPSLMLVSIYAEP